MGKIADFLKKQKNDIKDIYINLGILFFVALMFKSGVLTSEDTSSFKEDLQSIKRFFSFIKSDIKNTFKKKIK